MSNLSRRNVLSLGVALGLVSTAGLGSATASAAAGIATSAPYNCVPQTEDTITLLVDWQSTKSPTHRGTGVYTASWTAPLKAGVHSAQHWYYMAEKVSGGTFV